jgi:hypothetical protein
MPAPTSALWLLTLIADTLAAPITEVTVYSDRARVTRTATVDVHDRTRVDFAPLPPGADGASVRLEASGSGTVDTIEIRAPGQGEASGAGPALLADMERAADDVAQLERECALYTQLAGVTDWRPALDDALDDDEAEAGDRRRRPRLDSRGWRAGMAFLSDFAASMQGRLREATVQLEGRRRAHRALAERARGLAAPDARTLRVAATLAGRGRTTLRLRYEVAGARWTPRYEVRLQAPDGRVTVALAAAVSQDTGEDWRDARLVLSTAVPYAASGPPRLTAWRIGDGERFVPTPRAAPADGDPAPPPPPARPPLAPPPEPARAAPAPPGPEKDVGPGQIAGYVFDQTGSPLVGVRLAVAGAGARHAVYSDQEGFFRLVGVAPGSYDIVASAPKLRSLTQRGIVVRDSAGAEVNLVMEVPGAANEGITVMEKAPLISTTSVSVRQVFDLDMVEGLPMASRDTVHHQVASAAFGRGAARTLISLAPPPGYRRVQLPADAPAVLAGGRDLAFPAPGAQTLLSGGGERRVELATWRWPVAVERHVYPALADGAFLVAAVASPLADALPAGPAALFVGADPVGTARLKLVVPGQRFELPLGEDLDVRPVRQVTVETRRQGLIWKDEVSRYTVTTEIVNPHPTPVRVRLHDQIPVSPDRSVRVRLESSAPRAAVDARSGEVTWTLDLRPGAAATTRLVYTLARPEGHRLHQ